MLTVKNVTKCYGSFTVLENVSLELDNGVYGLLAPNGAGKSTLMKMLATLTFPTRGEILWNGTEIGKLGEQYRDVLGYLPQQFGYYPNYSPVQYLEYLAALKGLDKQSAKVKIQELLEMVGLSNVAKKKMKKFSGGMIQRVGIAQALLNDPKILILDEPTAGLDPKERVRFRNILAGLSKDRIVILSTHIVSDVETIANTIILLKDHAVAYEGTAQTLCAQMEGQVYEITIPDLELPTFEQTHLILGQRQKRNMVVVRFTGGDIPADAKSVTPTLEDVFLATYR